MKRHKGHHGGRYDDPHGVTAKKNAERIAGGDYEFEMDNERRMEREAPFAEGGYEDAAREERRGMME